METFKHLLVVLIRILWRDRTNRVKKEIYSEGLVHRIMAAEKPHDLRSASWRFRKASGVVQSESDGLRTRGADAINSSTVQDQMRCPSSSSEAGKSGKSLLSLPFVLWKPLVDR